MLPKFSKDVREIFVKLNDLRKNGDVIGFIEYLQDNIKNLGAHVHLLDKKSEKSLINSLKHELREKQDTTLAYKLAYIQLMECNNCFFNFKLEDATKKMAEKFAKHISEYLAKTDFIAADSPLHQNLQELAVIKKVITTTDEGEAAKLQTEIEHKIAVFSGVAPTEASDTKDALSESWCVVNKDEETKE